MKTLTKKERRLLDIARNEDGFGYDLRRVAASDKDAAITAIVKQGMIHLAKHHKKMGKARASS